MDSNTSTGLLKQMNSRLMIIIVILIIILVSLPVLLSQFNNQTTNTNTDQTSTATSSATSSTDTAVSDTTKTARFFGLDSDGNIVDAQPDTTSSEGFTTQAEDLIWPINAPMWAAIPYLKTDTVKGNAMTNLQVLNCDLYWRNLSSPNKDHRRANTLTPYHMYADGTGNPVSAQMTSGYTRNSQYNFISAQYSTNSVYQPVVQFSAYPNAHVLYAGEQFEFDTNNVKAGDRIELVGIACQLKVKSTGATFTEGYPMQGLIIKLVDANSVLPDQITIHRFYAPSLGTHFYTDKVAAMSRFPEYEHEGPAYTAFKNDPLNDPEIVPVYQFYNSRTRAHLWTIDAQQRDRIINDPSLGDFQFEGAKYYAYIKNATYGNNNYRFYNSSTGAHFFTAKPSEYEAMTTRFKDVFKNEGVAYKVLPAN